MKRGQAQVISIVLITLLVISGVSILGFAIYKFVNQSTEDSVAGKFLVNLQIRDVEVIDSENMNVFVERERGKGDLFAIRFVLFTEADSKSIAMPVTDFDEEEVQKFVFNDLLLDDFTLEGLEKISVTPILELKSGKNTSGDFSNEYDYKTPTPYCGDGNLDPGEDCDFRMDDTIEAGTCGDGAIQNSVVDEKTYCTTNCEIKIMEEVCETVRVDKCPGPIIEDPESPVCTDDSGPEMEECNYFTGGYKEMEGVCPANGACRGDCQACLDECVPPGL